MSIFTITLFRKNSSINCKLLSAHSSASLKYFLSLRVLEVITARVVRALRNATVQLTAEPLYSLPSPNQVAGENNYTGRYYHKPYQYFT